MVVIKNPPPAVDLHPRSGFWPARTRATGEPLTILQDAITIVSWIFEQMGNDAWLRVTFLLWAWSDLTIGKTDNALGLAVILLATHLAAKAFNHCNRKLQGQSGGEGCGGHQGHQGRDGRCVAAATASFDPSNGGCSLLHSNLFSCIWRCKQSPLIVSSALRFATLQSSCQKWKRQYQT